MRRILRFSKKIPRRYFILLVFILAVGVVFYFRNSRAGEPLAHHTVTRQVIKGTVSASGTLKGRDTVNLKFLSGGRLSYVGAEVGDRVTKGQVVARLDTQELSISLQQAKNILRDKQATLEKIYDDVKDHKADETFTQKQARTTAEVAKDNAYDQVRAIEAALRNNYVYSPIAGVVTQSPFLVGQFVGAADAVVQVANDSQVYFDAEVDEADIAKISVGQEAKVTLNSQSDKVLEGKVEKIIPQTKTSTSGGTVVIVRISLAKPETVFVSGINGQVEIVVAQTNSLAIPNQALTSDNKVYRFKNGKIEMVEIKTGIASAESTEVLEGLSENEEIITNPQVLKKGK